MTRKIIISLSLLAAVLLSGCGAGTIIASTLGGAAAVGSAVNAYESVKHRRALQDAILEREKREEDTE